MAGPVSQIASGLRVARHPGFVGEPGLEGTAGGTIAVGDFLITSSGTLIAASNGPTKGTLVGIATQATTTGNRVTYVPFWQGLELEGRLDGGTTTGTTLIVATHRWAAYGIAKDAGNGKWYLNFDDTTNKVFVIIDFTDAVGTTRGLVRCVPLISLTAGIWSV